MSVRFLRSLALPIAAVALLMSAGCNKKTTQVPPPAPAPAAPAPAPAPAAEEPDRFVTVDPDEAARQALQTVYFDYDRSEIRDDNATKLQTAAKYLSDNPTVRVLLEGHADERGSAEYNIGLGDRRARSVVVWLVNYGIASGRLEQTSYGRERPARGDCGDDDQCHAFNRRVEFKVLSR